MQQILWKQTFSNYHNIKYNLDSKQYLRFHHNITGNQIQFELTNQYDEVPLEIESLRVSHLPDFKDSVTVTLENSESFTIPELSNICTDYINFNLQAGVPIYIELLAHNKKNIINSLGSTLDTYLVKPASLSNNNESNFYFGISGINAKTTEKITIGFFGDSLTNQGYFSNKVSQQLYTSLPNNITTFNAGISGNRLLLPGTSVSEWNKSFGNAGIERFHCDVLENNPDIVISLIGINDLFHPGAGAPLEDLPTIDKMISGIEKLRNDCLKRGVTYIPVTITPFKGATNRGIYSWNNKKEQIRLQFNHYLKSLPYCIDLAEEVADVNDPALLNQAFDSGDHLHFSQKGSYHIGTFIYEQLQHLLKI